jgi:hypothetical protein
MAMASTLQWTGAVAAALVLGSPVVSHRAEAAAAKPIIVSPALPDELNPPFRANGTGGAPDATPEQAAAFAWQEFIALNWPATRQKGQLGDRDTPSATCAFSDPACDGPTVWETFRGKVEIFPGRGNPPGYNKRAVHGAFGYDAKPQYKYADRVPACDAAQESEPTPWVNVDETDQIALDNMYAGIVPRSASPGNSAPKLIRFLAKANRSLYDYVAANSSPTDRSLQWWRAIPMPVVDRTKTFLASLKRSPPAGSKSMVSLPFGTVEIKAGWRPLSKAEAASGRFHVRPVRFYEKAGGGGFCWRNADWGLVALHIIQKTPSAPHFIYATFEQADNILTADGQPVEDEQGRLRKPVLEGPSTEPQVCLVDPRPGAGPSGGVSQQGSVILTADPKTCEPLATDVYCKKPGARLYYRNFAGARPSPTGGNICIDKRDNAIPGFVIDANQNAHDAIGKYIAANGIASSPWLYYKLINVQYHPYDHIIKRTKPDGSLYKGRGPATADNPATSTYYQANIVVETNRSLQRFSGSVTSLDQGAIQTNWNADGTQHKNMYSGGLAYNMGGCRGCHGAQGQNPAGQAGDFSVILAIGSVDAPEAPIEDFSADSEVDWP